MARPRRMKLIHAIACVVALKSSLVGAQVAGTWIGPAAGSWTTAVNWSSNPQFPSSDGTAIFNVGPASVSLATTIQLQHLKLDTPGQITLTGNSLAFNNAASLIEVPRSKLNPPGIYFYTGHDLFSGINTGSNTLQISGPGAVTLRSSSGFIAPLLLNNGVELGITTSAAIGSSAGSILLDNATLRAILGAVVPRVVQVLPGGGTLAGTHATLRMTQQIVGNGPLTFAGAAGVGLDSDIDYAGDARIAGGGTVGLRIGGFSDGGSMRFYNSLAVGGLLEVFYFGGAQDRLGDGTLTLRGGTVSLRGSQTSESVGTIVLDHGHNSLALGGTNGSFTLIAATLLRRNRSTLLISAEGLGASSGERIAKVTFADSAKIPLIGGGGVAGTPQVSIIPFVSQRGTNSLGLVTYDTAGLRVLNRNTEYAVGLPSIDMPTTNVRSGGQTITSARAINALLLDGGSFGGAGTLTVTSGAILGGGPILSSNINCPLEFGESEGVITGVGSILGPISGSNGITINSAVGGPFAQTMLSGNQSMYTGTTTLIGNIQVFLGADMTPGTPGPFGTDSSPIVLVGQGIGSFGSRLGFTGASTRVIARDLIVRSEVDLLKGHETSLSMGGPQNFTGNITLEGPLRINGIATFSGSIDGPGRLIINPSISGGGIVLAGSNSFQGGVDLQVASLTITNDHALGTGTLFVGNGPSGTLNEAAILWSSRSNADPTTVRTISNPIVLNDHLTLSGRGTLNANGPINLNGEQRRIRAEVHTNIHGALSGGEIRWSGPGLFDGDNSQTKTIVISDGALTTSLVIASDNALGGMAARLTEVGSTSFAFISNSRLELQGGISIPAHPLNLYATLRNNGGHNIWRGPLVALGAPTINIAADSLSVQGGINGVEELFAQSINKTGPGLLSSQFIRTAGELKILSGAVRVTPDGTDSAASSLGSLTIAGASDAWQATFDLADNALVIHDSTALATIQNQLLSGYANGSWNGTGIQSSAAANDPQHATGIGLALGGDLFTTFPATFAGVSVNADSALLRYTLYGDANLDRMVNITDFALLAANFNTPAIWSRGDFNYDGNTNIADFALLAANFNQSLPVELPRQAVPEPGAIGTAAFFVTISLRRRGLKL